MAYSSGTRQAASMAAGWLVAAGASAFSLVYFSEIKEVARGLLGIPARSERAGDRGQAPRSWRRPVGERAATRPHGRDQGRRARPLLRQHRDQRPPHRRAWSTRAPRSWRSPTRTPSAAGVYIRDSDYTQRVNTANGLARIAPVMLDRVSIGDITVRNVPAAVSEPGKLTTSLLGMSFLNRLQRVDMRSGVLVLQE